MSGADRPPDAALSVRAETLHRPPPQYAGKVLAGLGLAAFGTIIGWAAFLLPWKLVLGPTVGLLVTGLSLVNPIAGMVFVVIALPIVHLFPPQLAGLKALNPLNLMILVVGASALGQAALRRRRVFPRHPMVKPLACFLGVLVFSLFMTAQDPPPGGFGPVLDDLKGCLTCFAPFFLTIAIVRTEKHRRAVFATLVVMVVLMALRALVEYAVNIAQGADPQRLRVVGLLGQANEFGGYLAMYVPVVLVAGLNDVRKLARPLILAGGIACVFALFFTQSRGGMLACGISIILLGFLRSRRLLLVFVLAGLMAPLWIPSVVFNRFGKTRAASSDTGQVELDRSSQVRLNMWTGGINAFKESPLVGHGFGSWRHAIDETDFDGEVRSPHSTYIRTLAENGIAGAVTLLWLMFASVRLGLARPAGLSPFDRYVHEAFLGASLAMVVVNVFGTRFYNIEENGYFWILAGLAGSGALPARPLAASHGG